MILDVHSHREAPYAEGVVSLRVKDTEADAPLLEGQAYSAGIHPWDSVDTVMRETSEEIWRRLETIAEDGRVLAIGECGIDIPKGGPLFRQMQILKRQIDLSERLGKPLILHCVKAADIIMGLKRDLQPRQPWIIHGFRGKPELARQLTDKGIFLSFGEKFNPDTIASMPGNMLLAETDESAMNIEEIIGGLSGAAGKDLTPEILSNTAAVLGLQE